MNRQILWNILDELNEECCIYSIGGIDPNRAQFAEADATRREVRELLDLPSEGILAELAHKYYPEFPSEL